mmetsp:Transcript_17611/g.40745  ORF Transcript_17611/g.40745 Transcript_17611/m.40745 type:complete len:1278 (+) Transcript_17611:109-3942(+)
MDLCAADDFGVHRGIQFLQGRETKTAASSSAGRTPSPIGRRSSRRPSEGPDGLELARRKILVVKPGEFEEGRLKETERASSVDSVAQGLSKVIVVDHGEQQRDAVRRLFEAQVLIQSQGAQLKEKDGEIADLQKRVMKAEQASHKIDRERQDVEHSTSQQEAEKAHKRQSVKGHHHHVVDKRVPFWLRNDESMRMDLDAIRQIILREYMSDGHLDAASLLEHMWQLAHVTILRWGTDPDEEIVKQNEAIEAKLRKVQRDALQETSMLRQSQRGLEKKYKELQQRSREAIEKLKIELRKHKSVVAELSAHQTQEGPGGFHHEGHEMVQGRDSIALQRRGTQAAGGSVTMRQAQDAGGGFTQHGFTQQGFPPMQQEGMHAMQPSVGIGGAQGGPERHSFAGIGAGEQSAGSTLAVPGASPVGQRVGGSGPAHLAATAPPGAMAVMTVGKSSPTASSGIPGGPMSQASPSAASAAAAAAAMGVASPTSSMPMTGQASMGGGLGSTVQQSSLGGLPSGSFTQFTGGAMGSTAQLASFPGNVSLTGPDMSFGPTMTGASFFAGASPTSTTQVNLEDNLDDINLDDMELTELDNELFEPLNSFDDDLKELMINTVNEKVRRILAMDPKKFSNGKLPFGLKPDKIDPGEYDRVRYLEGELENAKQELIEVRSQLEEATNKVDAQRLRMEGMKAKQVTDASDRQDRDGRRSLIAKEIEEEDAGLGKADVNPKAQARIRELLDVVHDLEEQLKARELELLEAKSAPVSPVATMQSPKEAAPVQRQPMAGQKLAPEVAPPAPAPAAEAPKPQSKAPPTVESVELAQKHEALLKKVLGFMTKGKEAGPEKQVEQKVTREFNKRRVNATSADLEKTFPMLEEWAGEVMKSTPEAAPAPAFESTSPVGKKPQRSKGAPPPKAFSEIGCGQKAVDDEDEAVTHARSAVKALQDKCMSQKEEISRLLLTIDEMRARLEKVMSLARNEGTEVREQMASVMAAAGLQEIMEAGSGPKLRAVFERLYQDAVQRMQRLRLILQRRVVANKAYNNAKTVQRSSEVPPVMVIDGGSLVDPELARFSETASATLKGMFYHYEHLFKRVSEYAEAQGLEDSALGNAKYTVSELLEAHDLKLGAEGPGQIAKTHEHSGSSLRKGEPAFSKGPPAEFADHGRAFWNDPGTSKASPKSPRRARSEHLADPQPTTFSSYVAALREARGDLKPDDWPRLGKDASRKSSKIDGLRVPAAPKSIAQLCEKGSGLNVCRSLPALPSKEKVGVPAEVGLRSPKGHDAVR